MTDRTFTRNIFVFGANLQGIHGAGAAKIAATQYGAVRGIGVGPTGEAYAIPTKSRPTRGTADTLPLAEIANYVASFLEHAQAHPNDRFLVTRIGCGLAGYSDAEVAPLFKDPPPNVQLPRAWHTIVFGAEIPDRVSFTE